MEQDLDELSVLLLAIREGDFLTHFRDLAPTDGRYTNDELLLSLAQAWLESNEVKVVHLINAGNITRDHLDFFTDAEIVEFSEAHRDAIESLRETLDINSSR